MSDDVFFAKGKRSRVYLTCYEGERAVRKVADSRFVSNIRNEAYWHLVLNKKGIGPKLYCFGNDFIVTELIDGERILEFFESADKKSILKVVNDVLKQCRKLDILQVDKKELTNPYKHIIVRKGKPVMIDFERCKSTPTPKNVTQFIQFLTSGRVMGIFSKKGITIDKERLRSFARTYKKSHSSFKIEIFK
jgi:putative serine/threonine protein kinase